MALIDPQFYTGPALIVGDGNFSFSACLAESLDGISPPVFATSLDTKEQLESSSLALANLKRISASPRFKAFHGVDATNLGRNFKEEIFQRIIFNFPHTGGKMKISECRKLLEKFFVSAAKHIEPTRGLVCVSLCQGQGGIPLDAVQRDYGNTWQVVEQASKAGFILNTVHPFREEDYPGYSSAGFKGRLNQHFLTEGGLTYMFFHCHPIPPIPDLNIFLQRRPSNHKKLFNIKGHPVEIVKTNLELCLRNLPRDTENKGFDVIDNEGEIQDIFSDSCSITSKYTNNIKTGTTSLYQRIQRSILEGQRSFVVTDAESNYSIPISAGCHPICHTSVIVKLFKRNSPLEDVIADLECTYKFIIQEICPGISHTHDKQEKKAVKMDLSFKRSKMNRFKPLDYQELRERQRIENEWRPLCLEKEEWHHCKECCEHKMPGNACKTCDIEEGYFYREIKLKATDLIECSETHKFCGTRGQQVIMSGLIINGMSMISDSIDDHGWAILVNLDNLAMELFEIKDIRMLWTQQKLFIQQFLLQNKDASFPLHFIPFSLFPPIYVHDITLWLTSNSTEEKFFKAIYEVTQNCVCDIWLKDRYIDEGQKRVSYTYRMLYSRCDGPLTHLNTVEMQNLLRRLLITLDFELC